MFGMAILPRASSGAGVGLSSRRGVQRVGVIERQIFGPAIFLPKREIDLRLSRYLAR
jgi:hypothetical protein